MAGVHGDIQTIRELLARAVERLDHITGVEQQPPNVQASRTASNPLITTSSSQGSARSGPEMIHGLLEVVVRIHITLFLDPHRSAFVLSNPLKQVALNVSFNLAAAVLATIIGCRLLSILLYVLRMLSKPEFLPEKARLVQAGLVHKEIVTWRKLRIS